MIWPQCLFSIIKDSFHLGFFRAHTAKMQFSHTIPHYIWCNCSYRISPMVNKKMHSNQVTANSFWFDQKRVFFCRCNCQSSPLKGSKNRFSFDQSEKKILTGKSLSEALIFASTNPQYDDRFFIELRVQYMKIATCCLQKLFFVLIFRAIYVHNVFWACKFHELNL